MNDSADPTDPARDPEVLHCQDLVELVTDYLDDALPPDDRRAFEAHLRDCDGCVHHLEQFRLAISLARTRPDEAVAVPSATMAALADAFRSRRPAPDGD